MKYETVKLPNIIMIAYRKEKEGNIITKKGEAMHNIGYKRLLVQYIGRQEPEQPIFTTQLTRHVARMTGRDEEDVKKAVNVNMARMEKDGQVVRIEKGGYCKKIRTAFGYYIPDKEAIFCRRLLYDEGEVIGYETGLSMLNRMGLVSQMPKKMYRDKFVCKKSTGWYASGNKKTGYKYKSHELPLLSDFRCHKRVRKGIG